MSVQATAWVIQHSEHKGSNLLLLIMIANHAHADGTGAWPSVSTLAKECRMSERQIKRMLPELDASGELVVFWSKGRRAHEYAIAMGETNRDILSRLKAAYFERLNQSDSDNLSPLNHDILSPSNSDISDANSDISGTSTVTNRAAHIRKNLPLKSSIEKRDIPPGQKAKFEEIKRVIADQLSGDIFQTWFASLTCAGIDNKTAAVSIETSEVTADWINRYYSELVEDALAHVGLSGYKIEWLTDEVNMNADWRGLTT